MFKLNTILQHFQKVDPILFKTAKEFGIEQLELRNTEDYFHALCYEIVGQQLAKQVARTIFSRFQTLFPNNKITAKQIQLLSEETLRNTGMSWSKARFIKDLAQKVNDKTLNLANLTKLDNMQVIKALTSVKGIGPWTAEMFLMFTLGREDVFSYGDLGLKNAIIKLYSLNKDVSKAQIENIVSKWSPYKTYACKILWKSLRN